MHIGCRSGCLGPLRSVDLPLLGKIFAFFYAVVGIPITLLYLGQCGRMLTSLWPGKKAILPAVGFLLFSALIYDIVEQGTDDTVSLPCSRSLQNQRETIGMHCVW